MNHIDRRSFVLQVGTAGLALAAGAGPATSRGEAATASSSTGSPNLLCAFTESFQSWPIPEVCRKFKSIGLDGLDLTVRPGGHIEPTDAPKKLPDAVKAADDAGVKILMLSTAVNDVDRVNEELVATAGRLGIKQIKAGYNMYEGFGTLIKQVDDAKRRIERVAALCKKHGVQPCIHIHCGKSIPNCGAMAYILLRDFSPQDVGAYVDPMHMTLEGGVDGWRQGLDLVTPWIALSSIKNARWQATGRDKFGQMRWTDVKCPVADGAAPIPDYIAILRQLNYRGLYTLHSEYQGGGSWKNLNADECLAQTQEDLKFVRQCLAG